MTQDIKRYGRTDEEKRVEKTIQCRQIVSEILNFGVDEFQKAKIIQLLSGYFQKLYHVPNEETFFPF